jgi:TatD DNase family protein
MLNAEVKTEVGRVKVFLLQHSPFSIYFSIQHSALSIVMVDSHCHLADDAFAEDLAAVIDRARGAGVRKALCILAAGDEKESAAASHVRALWPDVCFSVGVHPHQAGQFAGRLGDVSTCVREGLRSERARAIGEIGLDYHYDFSPRDVQQEVFRVQVALARELGLPVVIHTREATDDTFQILRDAGPDLRGVFHCFTGGTKMAADALDLGFFISLAGIVTFPRASELREVARLVPDDRLLVETDAPYLAPVPYRGKRNEPSFVARVTEAIAEVRGVSAADLGSSVTRNFEAFLGPTVSHQTA